MAYTAGDFDRDHIQLTWGGTLPGNETWSCSLKLADARVGSPVIGNDGYIALMNLGDFADFAQGPVADFHGNGSSFISPEAVLTYCKVAKIQHDGRMNADDNSVEYVYPAPVPGGGSSGILYPNQCSLAVSLTTNVTRGPAHRGRFFMPLPSMVLSGVTGTIDYADATLVAESAAAFIESVSDVPGIDVPSSPGVVVMSRKSGAATAHIVTGVEVGRVIDTQRRRRRSLPEGYANATVSQGIA